MHNSKHPDTENKPDKCQGTLIFKPRLDFIEGGIKHEKIDESSCSYCNDRIL